MTGQVQQLHTQSQSAFGYNPEDHAFIPNDADSEFGTTAGKISSSSSRMLDHPATKERSGTLPQSATRPSMSTDKRSNSYDDRPLQAYFGAEETTPNPANTVVPVANGGLGIPGRATTKEERRRSMNPPPRQPSRTEMRASPGTPLSYMNSSDSETSARASPTSGLGDRSSPSTSTSYMSHTPHRSPAQSQQTYPLSESGLDTTSSAASSAFPPRGKSLRVVPVSKSSKGDKPITQSLPTKIPPIRIPVPGSGEDSFYSRSTPSPSPSFSVEPASDEENDADDATTLQLAGPGPNSRRNHDRDSPSYSDLSSQSAASTMTAVLQMTPPSATVLTLDEERTPVQTRRTASSSSTNNGAPQLEAPAPELPPIRLSLHTTDFGDLLKSVAGTSPRVPVSRESFLRISTGQQTLDEDGVSVRGAEENNEDMQVPLSPSGMAQERIKAIKGPTNHYDTGNKGAPTSAPLGASLAAPYNGTTRQRSGSASGALSAPTTAVDHHGPGHEKNRLLGLSYAAMNGSSPNLGSSTSIPLSRTISADLAGRRLREAFAEAQSRGASTVKLDSSLVEALLKSVEASNETQSNLREELDLTKVCLSQITHLHKISR